MAVLHYTMLASFVWLSAHRPLPPMIRTSEISNPKTAHSEDIIYLKGRSPPGPGPTVHIDHLTNAQSPVEVEKVATVETELTLKVFHPTK